MSPEVVTLSDAILFSLLALALIMGCAWLLDSRRGKDRVIFGMILIVMLLNYLYFRITKTLPDFEWSAYAVWPRAYLSFEIVVIFYTALSIVFFFRRTDHGAAADASELTIAGAASPPAVDVFICTYNEDLSILERTILAAKAIDYQSFTVWVLDDGRRDWLEDYCTEVGVRYLRRNDNVGAKGGNLNNAIQQSAKETNAPFILILDADFAPQRPILKRTVGQFADPQIGVIQTPQFYYNADPVQHNLLASKAWVDDQRIFFDVMQPSKDGWGAAFCVGTSCIVRRDALGLIGGMPQETVTEDIHLTYRLLQKGLKTRWLNERLSVGLSAESLSGYITQRCRWCLGTIQVALLRDGPFLGRGYTFLQRLHYFHGLLFWFCRPFILLLMAAPILYYFLGLPAIQMEPEAFFLYALPMVGGMWAFHAWVSGRRSMPLFTEVSQMVSAVPITIALIHALIHPFGRPFKVTAKGEDRARVDVLYPIAGTFLLVIILTFMGMLNGPLMGTYNDLDGFSVAWGMVVMVYAFVSLLVCIELPREPLDSIRFPLARQANLVRDGNLVPCTINTISISKAEITLHDNRTARQISAGDILIFSPFADFDVAARVSDVDIARLALSMAIVAVRDRRYDWKIRQTAEDVRRKMIQRLFSEMPQAMPARAYPLAALRGLWRRTFNPPSKLFGSIEKHEVSVRSRQAPRRWQRRRDLAPSMPLLQVRAASAGPPLAE
ncbi:cellulose synthase (UDP-forming) [Rhizobium azibense]|uniref:Cellulose synthase (UDP-forming) n=1 Tax=Rhizobium azibense TaxID=1136135 RepID=A0A4R3QVS7_9HYPH|nr:cellulose synthase catalytic subunit [Rhizobium azibense]TCU25457.1 cellulose synthase (UDP-forming) [Rhizobium azibense]